ncbi:DUF1102 domain-containing protein [Archaeoglobus fulgidus]|uniref:DUF1102 domain-containing protein n=1 Tax=Archaeoglobus fulgidus (strain ATCC 49558 / DSM 4304 / JCM 9628 / NBRC 100126 / VC-16) TaxID=224325 RepID=O28200_ARCFU|nr:DUF1102 domain-containing protein [Archaeoglobus fulgidus]AAB89180.1 predicted coding region AF_2079 [Archaeoglobus fulgidus DSM 4304]
MKKLVIAITLLLIALGWRAPAISAIAAETINGVLLYSPSPYGSNEENLTIDITENNPNYPGYGKGLSPGSTYRFDDLLRIENGNGFPVCVVLHSQSDLIRFYTSGEALQTISFSLAVNESISVGVEFSSTELGLMEESYSIKTFEGECDEAV